MTQLTMTPASNDDEAQLALKLAISVFEIASRMTGYARYKALLWHEDPSFKPENLMLARLGGGTPCGLVRIVPRTVHRADQSYSVAGISSVCLEPSQRGKGFSVDLMERTLEHCRERGFDFAFLFARRAADHYYTRFGFWGIASYSRIAVRIAGLAADSNIALGDADERLMELYGAAYNRCYAGTFGRMARSPDYWRFTLRRVHYLPELQFSTLLKFGAPVGYVLWSKVAIHELAYVDDLRVEPLVTLLAELLPGARSAGSLTLELPPQHLFVGAAYGLDMTLSARECTYGGHMACILNPRTLLDRLALRAPAAAAHLGHLVRAGQFSHRDTCRLLGAWSPSDPKPSDEHALPYDMSVADHF